MPAAVLRRATCYGERALERLAANNHLQPLLQQWVTPACRWVQLQNGAEVMTALCNHMPNSSPHNGLIA